MRSRRQSIGSLLEAPAERTLSLPEAANLPDDRVDPETLYTNLVHHHLPMMAKAKFIGWEKEPFMAWRGPRFEEVAAVILAIDTDDELSEHLKMGCHFHKQNGAGQ